MPHATLTKRDIVVELSNETGLVQHEVVELLQRLLDLIVRSLSEGKDVELRNFGVFSVRLTKERLGHNPKDPSVFMTVPSRVLVKFKCGKTMRQKVEVALRKSGKIAKISPVRPRRATPKAEVAKAA